MPGRTDRLTSRRFVKWLRIGLVVVLSAFFLVASYTQASITVPSNNLVFFQTTGEQANIDIGDYYTNVGGDNTHHLAEINIPCVPNVTFRIELFDPELYDAAGEAVNDELRGAGDQTNFLLRQPDDSPVGTTTVYGPYPQFPAAPPPEHDNWVEFRTITLPAVPQEGVDCGTYSIEVWTGNEVLSEPGNNNDDNAWRYRLMGGAGPLGTEAFDSALGPDGRAGTGDEAWLGLQRLSYQLNNIVTQSFYWFVDDDGDPAWVGRNFDVDNATLCSGNCSVDYVSPTLVTFAGTVGDSAQWNPGQATRGEGDPHNEEPGLWRADITVDEGNQYIFEVTNGGKPIFPDPPILPNLTINKDDGATVVTSPGTTTYTLTLTNTGAGAAMPMAGPEVVDTLPAGMTFASCTVNSPLVGTCTPAGNLINIDLVPQTQALNSPGLTPFGPILAYLPGAGSSLVNSGTITVTVNVAAGIAGGTTLDNLAAVDWSDVYDNNYRPVSDNDVDTVEAAPQAADLAVTKIDLADPVTAGSNVTYQITVTNLGPDTAVGAVLTDSIPAGTTFVSASAGCSAAGATVTCNLGDIASPGSVAVNVTVATGAAGIITDTASVTSNTSDPVSGNNSDGEDTTVIGPVPTQVVPPQAAATQLGVVPSLDPTISKRADPPFALPGDLVTWTITVSNPGSTAATNVTVTDSLPNEVVIVSVSSSSGNVVFSGQSVTFTQAVLGPGESVSIDVVTRLRPDLVPPYSLHNLASLTNAENPNPRYAQASVVGASSLPATGESPWSRWRTPLFALGLIASGLAVISLARRRGVAR
jgi:uncharacterized repeat protein (TIGR01451 family)